MPPRPEDARRRGSEVRLARFHERQPTRRGGCSRSLALAAAVQRSHRRQPLLAEAAARVSNAHRVEVGAVIDGHDRDLDAVRVRGLVEARVRVLARVGVLARVHCVLEQLLDAREERAALVLGVEAEQLHVLEEPAAPARLDIGARGQRRPRRRGTHPGEGVTGDRHDSAGCNNMHGC